MSRDELLALPSVQISLRSIRDVRLIDSVDMEEVSFNDSIKSESHSRNHSRNASIGDLDNSNFSVSDGNSLNSKLADRSFDLITSISHSSAKEVEKLLYNDNIEGNVLRIRWKSRSSMKPWNLVVLDYEGCANELYLRECYHVIKTHRQMAEFRVKTTVRFIQKKLLFCRGALHMFLFTLGVYARGEVRNAKDSGGLEKSHSRKGF